MIPDLDLWTVVKVIIAVEFVLLLLVLFLPSKHFVCRKRNCLQRHTRWHKHMRRTQ